MNSPKSIFTLLICLYFSQGLPSGLLAHALPALMRNYGVSLEWISLLKLLAIPWFLKFLWAPYIDQYWQRKYWIVLFQTTVIGILLVLSGFDPQTVFSDYLLAFLLLLLLLNFSSASQDIASDGIAVQQLSARHLGLANSIQVGAYKVGLIAGGTALLILLDHLGWQYSLLLFACLLAIALVPVVLLRNHQNPIGIQPNHAHMPFKAVFTGFIREKNMVLWLGVIATYKMADGLGSSMLKPMLIDYGYSLSDIGYLTSISSISGILGATLSGLLFLKMPLRHALLGFGLLQAASIGLLALIPSMIETTGLVYALALLEQFADGMSTVALFAAMMMHCRKGLEGTDYTLQNSVHLVGAGTASLAGGFIAAATSYQTLFMIASGLGLLTLAFVFIYHNEIQGQTQGSSE